MAEPPAWQYQKLIKPMFDLQPEHMILRGYVLTCVGDEVFEDGFVEFEGGKITAVGAACDLGTRAAQAISTGCTILPGLMNNHAHLAWDGIHDLARQSMDDAPEISAYKSAGNMLISLAGGCHHRSRSRHEQDQLLCQAGHRPRYLRRTAAFDLWRSDHPDGRAYLLVLPRGFWRGRDAPRRARAGARRR